MSCARCGAAYRPADPECPRCGLPLTPSIGMAPATGLETGSETGTGSGPTAIGSRRSWIVLGGGCAVLLLGAFLVLSWFDGDDPDPRGQLGAIGESADELHPEQLPPLPLPTPVSSSSTTGSSAPTNTTPANDNLAALATITADRTAPPGQDDEDRPVTYGTDHLADGDLTTAWRAPGYYNGEAITFELPEATQIQVLGLTNGYTKRDPGSGADRYQEGRRILSVTWSFDNGRSVHQSLEDDTQTLQRIRIDPTLARTVTLRVDQTTTPGRFTSDFTAISEVFVGS